MTDNETLTRTADHIRATESIDVVADDLIQGLGLQAQRGEAAKVFVLTDPGVHKFAQIVWDHEVDHHDIPVAIPPTAFVDNDGHVVDRIHRRLVLDGENVLLDAEVQLH